MNIPINNTQFAGIITALQNMGFKDLKAVTWVQSPMRVAGVWRAVVRHG